MNFNETKYVKATLALLVTFGILIFSLSVFSQTQSELNRTAREDFDAANKQLLITYQKLFDALDTVGQKKLAAAQQAWVAYREAEAALEEDEVRGGSAAPTVLNAARAELTRQRTKQLERLLSNN